MKLETSNLASILITRGNNEKKCKNELKGTGKGSRDLLLEFRDPLHISGTVEAINFKFGTNIDHPKPLTKKCKIKSKAVEKGSRDILFEFLDPLHISRTAKLRSFKFGTRIDHERR